MVPGVLLPHDHLAGQPLPGTPGCGASRARGRAQRTPLQCVPPFACPGRSVRPVHESGSVPRSLPRAWSDSQAAVAEPQRKRSLVGPYPLRREPPDGLSRGMRSPVAVQARGDEGVARVEEGVTRLQFRPPVCEIPASALQRTKVFEGGGLPVTDASTARGRGGRRSRGCGRAVRRRKRRTGRLGRPHVPGTSRAGSA